MQLEATVPRTWYMNCTSGGTFLDVAVEMEARAKVLKFVPKCVILAVRTNDAGRHMVTQHAKKTFPDCLQGFTVEASGATRGHSSMYVVRDLYPRRYIIGCCHGDKGGSRINQICTCLCRSGSWNK